MNNRQFCNNKDMQDIDAFPVAMAYVPWQYWDTTYEIDKALDRGTIFPELDKPFLGMKGGKR